MKSDRILVVRIAFLLVLIALLEPSYLARTSLHKVLGLVRYSSFALAIPVAFAYRMYKDKVYWVLLGFVAWLGLSSWSYSHTLSDSFVYNTSIMLTMLVLIGFGMRIMPRFTVASTAGVYALWLFLEGVTWKSGGLYININAQQMFFLGTKTTMTYYLIPGLLFILTYIEISKRKGFFLSRLLFIMAVFGSAIYLVKQPISTAILCSALLIIGIYLVERRPSIGKPVMKYGFLTTLVMCGLFVYNIVQKMFSFIIVDLLHENLELNGRAQIWDQVLSYIYKKPLMGYGYSSGIRFDVWQEYNTSTHNFYLFVVFSAGVIGLAIYLYAIWLIHKKLLKHMESRISRYILLVLVVVNVACITEIACFNAMYFSVLALAANIKYLLPTDNCCNIKLDNGSEYGE